MRTWAVESEKLGFEFRLCLFLNGRLRINLLISLGCSVFLNTAKMPCPTQGCWEGK